MDLGIAGKVALVSGGSHGMGRATAELFGREGCKVVIAALVADKEAIDDAVAAIRTTGGEAIGFAGDMTVRDDVEAAVAAAKEAFGSPDIVVGNVGGPKMGYFDDVADDDFVVALNQMVMSMVYLVRAVIPHMRAQGWGRIVNINSVGAKEPPPDLAHVLVNPARAAVVALQKSLSNEYARHGVTFNSIGTGFIATDRMVNYMRIVGEQRGIPTAQVISELAATVPANRIGTPEEMAATIAFLCSQGAGYINGELIAVDGGWHQAAF